jgi:hypothetical protein
MRNPNIAGRKELVAHRRFVTGVTASVPAYKEVDQAENKEWLVDVYIGPLEDVTQNIIRDVPIAPYARQLIGDVRQPVLLERSKQGKYSVIGRSKELPAGFQLPEGSILEPTYHRIEYNYSKLRLSYVADLDYELEAWGAKEWEDPGLPWQAVTVSNAFGRAIIGPGVAAEDLAPLVDPVPVTTTTTKHLLVKPFTWGPGGDPDALVWGTTPWGAMNQKTLELVE